MNKVVSKPSYLYVFMFNYTNGYVIERSLDLDYHIKRNGQSIKTYKTLNHAQRYLKKQGVVATTSEVKKLPVHVTELESRYSYVRAIELEQELILIEVNCCGTTTETYDASMKQQVLEEYI